VSPGFAGCQVPVDPGHRMGESGGARRVGGMVKGWRATALGAF
jgi:hypothetical protein